MNKYNPVRICSCQACRNGSCRRWYFKVANRKHRHKSNQQLKSLSDFEQIEKILIAGGYTD